MQQVLQLQQWEKFSGITKARKGIARRSGRLFMGNLDDFIEEYTIRDS